jgi:hypothetical protein
MTAVSRVHQRGFAGLVGCGVIGAGIKQAFELRGIARLGSGK